MSRRTSDEALAAELATVSVVGAGIILAIIVVVLIALVSELWRVFKAHAFQRTQASRMLWIAFASLLVLLLIAGLLASNPVTASAAPIVACWSLFVFILACELIDWRERRNEPTVPATLSLAEVVSWRSPSSAVATQPAPARKAA